MSNDHSDGVLDLLRGRSEHGAVGGGGGGVDEAGASFGAPLPEFPAQFDVGSPGVVAVGGGEAGEGVGASVVWMGRVALEGVRLVASGAVVPSVKVLKRPDSGPADAAVRWLPALGTSSEVDALVAAMPPTVAALGGIGKVPDVQAGCLVTVSDIVVEGEFLRISDEEMQAAVDRMTRVALATVTSD